GTNVRFRTWQGLKPDKSAARPSCNTFIMKRLIFLYRFCRKCAVNPSAMFKNYVKTAFRSLWRNKRYSIINITGLTAGIAVFLVIVIIIRYERSFDDFHQKKDR